MQTLSFGSARACGHGWDAAPVLLAAMDSGVWAGCGGSSEWRSLGAVIWGSAVAADPKQPSRLYVCGSSLARGTGLLRSVDGGNTWRVPDGGLPFAWYNTVAVDPTHSSTVLVAGVGGVYRSTDFGSHWSAVSGIGSTEYIGGLALHQALPDVAFASGTGGIYRSVDAGRSWARLAIANAGYGDSLAIHATRHGTEVFAVVDGALWRSGDRGDAWSPVYGVGLPSNHYMMQISVDPSTRSPAILYALVFDFDAGLPTLHRSPDGGGTWQRISPSLASIDLLQSVSVDPQRPDTVYATSSVTGLQTSRDGGQTWRTTSNKLIGTTSRVAVAPSAPMTLYAGSYNSGPFRSTDGGRSWTIINEGFAAHDVQALAVDPYRAATLYVGTSCCGVFGSADGGTHWSPRNDGDLAWLPMVQALAIDPTAPATLYAGTVGANVFKTTDAHTWTWSGNGLPGANVYAIAIDPKFPSTVYASLYDGAEGPPDTRVGYGVFKSTDGGGNWVPASAGLGNPLVRTLAVDPVDSTTIYAGTHGDGVFKSVDGGASWAPAGASGGRYVASILIEPSQPSTVYAATYDAGVFRSTNGGRTWSALNRGLDVPTTSLQGMALDPTRQGHLFLGTFMDGVAILNSGPGH